MDRGLLIPGRSLSQSLCPTHRGLQFHPQIPPRSPSYTFFPQTPQEYCPFHTQYSPAFPSDTCWVTNPGRSTSEVLSSLIAGHRPPPGHKRDTKASRDWIQEFFGSQQCRLYPWAASTGHVREVGHSLVSPSQMGSNTGLFPRVQHGHSIPEHECPMGHAQAAGTVLSLHTAQAPHQPSYP